jgi:hypothetical protein
MYALHGIAMSTSGLPTYADTVKAWPSIPPDKGRVIVYWATSTTDAGMNFFDVEMNGLKVTLIGDVFVYDDFTPGEYALTVKGHGLFWNQQSVNVSVVRRKTTYIELSGEPMVSHISAPKLLDAATEKLTNSRHGWKDAEPWSRHDEKGGLKPAIASTTQIGVADSGGRVAGIPDYPRRLIGQEIVDHFHSRSTILANLATKPVRIEISKDGSVRRECRRCHTVWATGTAEVKVAESEICFTWHRVHYPETGCFQLLQENEDTFSVRDSAGRSVLKYADVP